MAKVLLDDSTIGALAANHAGLRAVFEDFGLDYYCAAHLSIDEAAQAAGIDPDRVREAMARVREADRGPTWLDLPLIELIDHLDRAHRQLLRSSLFKTAVLLDDALARRHEACVESLRHHFRIFSELLLRHIELEEVALFPTAVAMESQWSKGEPVLADPEAVKRTIRDLVLEHGEIARSLDALILGRDEVRRLKDEECREIAANLDGIARHVHEYLNLETCVLFPRVVAMLG